MPSNGSSRKRSFGRRQQRGRERQLLAHAVREVRDERGPGPLQIHQLQQIAGAVTRGRGLEAVYLGDERQGLGCREALEERQIFGHDADPPLHGHGIRQRIHSEDAHRAGARPQQSRQALDGRRLAGAVRAEEAKEAAGRDGEVDAIDGAQRPEVAGEPMRFNRQFHAPNCIPAAGLVFASRPVETPRTM